jgi:ABC-type branched-subunit amino acid transport system substrate-binding protein
MKKLLFLFFVLISISAMAQSRKVQKNYTIAYQLFNQGKYISAKDAFNEIRNSGENNKLVENAYFFYAKSAFENQETEVARDAFQAMLEKYPNWESRSEIQYILADIAFQNKDHELGLAYLKQIQNAGFKKDIAQMKGFYLTQTPLLKLRVLYQTFPKDTIIAQVLVDKIATNSEDVSDYDLMESLIAEFKLTRPEKAKLKQIIYRRRPYKVGVMLPFDFEKLKKRETTTLADISINMYQGMRLAQKEMDSLSQVRFKLYAYEINRNSEADIDKMILKGEFNDMDLVIGPLFPDSYKKMIGISESKSFNLVQPLTSTQESEPRNFTYSFLPAFNEQADAVLNYINTKVDKKATVILYDRLNKELAFAFQQKAQAAGIKILAMEEIKTVELNQIKTIISNLNPSEIGSFMVSSSSQLLAQEVLKYMNVNGIKVPTFVPSAWLKFQDIDYAEYERFKILFIYPDYVNMDTPQSVHFKAAFQKFFKNEEPSQYAYLGYELAYLFAEMLDKYGTQNDFKRIFKQKGVIKGKIIEGIDFSKGSVNAYVPILRINNGEPELVNALK